MAWIQPKTVNENPGSRAAHSCDVIGSLLQIFGGWNGKRALNDLNILDTETLVWSEPEKKGQIPDCRNNHTTVVVGNKLFVQGGHDGSKWLSDLHVLELNTTIWSKAILQGINPSARACHTMSKVDSKIYMFGGYDGSKCFNDIDILDLDTMSWIQPEINGKIPLARNAHTITVINNQLLLFGGHSGNKHLKDLHIFDTINKTWSEPNIFGTLPPGLRGHSATLIGNKIYLFGGYDGRGRSNDIWEFDIDKFEWNHPIESEKTPAGRQRHSASLLSNKQIQIFGGFDGNKWLNDLQILDIGQLEAQTITDEALNTLIKNMKRLLNSDIFSDIKFKLEDDKIIQAHKCILASQCDYFRAMFLNDMKESTDSTIQIKDWGYEAYLLMLEFIQTGNISKDNSSATIELIALADAYNIESLKHLCENTLIHSVDCENVCNLLIHSNRQSVLELKKQCIYYIAQHFKQLNTMQEFETLGQVPTLLIEVTRAIFEKTNIK